MTDWPQSAWEHGPTIHPWSRESIGGIEVAYQGTLTGAVSAAWPAANRALYVPFGLTKSIVAKTMFVYNGATVSGNFDVGIYDAAGRRLVSSGSTAQATINVLQGVDIADTELAPGLFFLALAFDNGTATTFRSSIASASRRRMMGMFQQASAFPLPANATFATEASGALPVFGLCTRTVI